MGWSGCAHAQQFVHRAARHRIPPVRRNLRERFEDEPPLAKARVWNSQPLFVDHAVCIEDEVDIQCSRCTRIRPLTTETSLDLQERVEQIASRERSLPREGCVQKAPLRPDPYWFRFVKRGHAQVAHDRSQRRECLTEVLLPIAEITAERDCDAR